MKILFTGFTSRTVNGPVAYDFISNVYVLKQALELAGHTVDHRRVSLEEHDLADRYDIAFVGIAACNGLSSRFKLGGMWTLHQMKDRARIFPSDGRNVGVFINSVRSSFNHIDTFLGAKLGDRNNVVDHEIGFERTEIWKNLLEVFLSKKVPWKMLVPTFSWGQPGPYAKHYGADVTVWDPSNLAWPMQFDSSARWPEIGERQRKWIMPTLQDQDRWLNKEEGDWHVIEFGNKRKGGEAYVSETELLERYRTYEGTLAFAYPLASGGWWRMRYLHAAITGAVLCCGSDDRGVIGEPYNLTRRQIEVLPTEDLRALAVQQHRFLFTRAWPKTRAIETVDHFTRGE